MIKESYSQALANLVEDYSIWFGQVIAAAFYQNDESASRSTDCVDKSEITPPSSFKLKIGALLQETHKGMPSQLVETEEYMCGLAQQILSMNEPPSLELFNSFWQAFDGFLNIIQRMEKDALLADYGIDQETGMRSIAVMESDILRELERRSRRGQPFCIAMARIDDPKRCGNIADVKAAARIVLGSIRIFDDAYVTGQGEFLVCLKHADAKGGLKFSTRLNEELKKDLDIDFTMSCCVAEPLPGDSVPGLIANIRKDLNHISGFGDGATGQYEDISPLNRYIQSLKKDGAV